MLRTECTHWGLTRKCMDPGSVSGMTDLVPGMTDLVSGMTNRIVLGYSPMLVGSQCGSVSACLAEQYCAPPCVDKQLSGSGSGCALHR